MLDGCHLSYRKFLGSKHMELSQNLSFSLKVLLLFHYKTDMNDGVSLNIYSLNDIVSRRLCHTYSDLVENAEHCLSDFAVVRCFLQIISYK